MPLNETPHEIFLRTSLIMPIPHERKQQFHESEYTSRESGSGSNHEFHLDTDKYISRLLIAN